MKKAQLLVYPILVGLIFAVVVFFIVGPSEQVKTPQMFPGKRAAEVVMHGTVAQKEILAGEQIGKYASWKALFDLANEGGFSYQAVEQGIAPCGNVGGRLVAYWNSPEKECYPTKQALVNAYYTHLQNSINSYLVRRYGAQAPSAYEFSVIEEKEGLTEVVGVALEPTFFQFPPPNETFVPTKLPRIIAFSFTPWGAIATAAQLVEYSILEAVFGPEPSESAGYAASYALKLDFHATLDYDFDQFMDVIEHAKQIISACKEKNDEERKACVQQKTDSFNRQQQKWAAQPFIDDPRNRVFLFKVTEAVLNPYFNEQPEYAFALYIGQTTS
ncbi:hypothetical protein J4457_06490 [Candidatus Woesearchaeota archaeon]|nr:hypothetical protein [Candidatus Woesearchaeota archaeon]